MFIQGNVSSKFADVNNDNQLLTDASARHRSEFLNGKEGKVWALHIDAIDPVGADDKFFYLNNTGSVDIKIHSIRMSSTVAGVVTVKKVSGTPSFTAGADVAPLSMRSNTTPTVQATIKTDTNTTGLTDEGVWDRISLDTADREVPHEIPSTIMIGPGGSLALEWSAATGILSGMIYITEDDN